MAEQRKRQQKSTTEFFYKKYSHNLLIACFALVLYFNSIPNGYNLDDELVTQNHKLTSQGIAAIPEIWSSPYYSDNMGYAYDYRPMVHTSFAIEHQFFGDHPSVSHFINALLYALLCNCLFLFLLKLLGDGYKTFSWLAVLLFVAHPIHTEVVASIKNRDEILAFLFSVIAALYAMRFWETTKKHYLFLMVLFFVIGLLSKQSGLSFAFLIPFALVLFNKPALPNMFLVGNLLWLPALFLVDLDFAQQKVLLLIAFNSGLLLLFYLITVDFKKLFNAVKQWGNKLVSRESVTGSKFLKHPALEISLRQFNRWHGTLLLLLTIIQFTVFITSSYLFIALCLAGGIVASFFLRGVALVIMDFFMLGMCLRVFFYSDIDLGLAMDTTGLWIILRAIHSKGNLRWFYTGFLLVFGVTMQFFSHAPKDFFPLYALLFLFHKDKKNKPVFYALFAFLGAMWLHTILVFIKDQSIFLHYDQDVFFVPFSLVVSVLLYTYGTRYVKAVYTVCVTLVLIVFLVEGFMPVIKQRVKVDETLADIRVKPTPYIQSPKFTPGKVDRPLNFAETPVVISDPLAIRVATGFDILLRYFKLCLLPYPLSFYYGYSVIKASTFKSVAAIVGLLIYSLLAVVFLFSLRQYKLVAFGVLLYLVAIAPFSTVFRSLPGMMGERYLFIPSFGFCIVIMVLFYSIFKITYTQSFSLFPAVAKYALVVWLLVYTGLTVARNAQWETPLMLMRHDIQIVPQSAQANNVLALHLMQAAADEEQPAEQTKLINEALTHFKAALTIHPSFFNVAYDIGRAYAGLGLADSVFYYFKLAAAIDPANELPELNLNLGILYQQKELNDSAINYYNRFIELSPQDFEGYNNLAYLYFKLAKYEQSIAVLKQAITQLPQREEFYLHMGETYEAIKQPYNAAIHYQKALTLNPGNNMVRQKLQELQPQ